MAKTPEQTRQPEKVRDQIWAFYHDLKLWKQKPFAMTGPALAERVDDIFGHRTCYHDLGQVLEQPEIPLHIKASENDLPDQTPDLGQPHEH